jgi:hypothetical protein
MTAIYLNFNRNKEMQYNQMLLDKLAQLTPTQSSISQLNKENIIINNETQKPKENIVINNETQKPKENIIINNETQKPKENIVINNDNSFIEKRKILEYRDSEVKYNDFKPPERRIPEYLYPTKEIKQIINIPSRGYPDNYQLMGVLLRENTETAFNLFGRQTYPGSNQYEYYAQGTMHNNHVKLPINKKGGKELYDGDEVRIPGTNGDKGLFKVKLYELNIPRYNPFEL